MNPQGLALTFPTMGQRLHVHLQIMAQWNGVSAVISYLDACANMGTKDVPVEENATSGI